MNNNGEKEVIYFVRKRHFKPQRERSGVRRKNTITLKVELQSVGFVTKAGPSFFEIAQKEEGQESSKNMGPSKDIFKDRIQSTV